MNTDIKSSHCILQYITERYFPKFVTLFLIQNLSSNDKDETLFKMLEFLDNDYDH